MSVCCECCVLSGRGLYDALITRPEETYRMWCVVVCGLETSRMRRPWPALGCSATEGKKVYHIVKSKVKVHPCKTLRLCTGRTEHRRSRGIALLFLDHGTRRGWGVIVTPWPLFTPGKDPVPIVQEAWWAPGPVWTGAENLAHNGIRSPDCSARSQSLYRLRYPAHLSYSNQRYFVQCPTIHNKLTNYYTARTCFDTIVSSLGSSSVPAKLHKYANAVLIINVKFRIRFLLSMFKIIKIIEIILFITKCLK